MGAQTQTEAVLIFHQNHGRVEVVKVLDKKTSLVKVKAWGDVETVVLNEMLSTNKASNVAT